MHNSGWLLAVTTNPPLLGLALGQAEQTWARYLAPRLGIESGQENANGAGGMQRSSLSKHKAPGWLLVKQHAPIFAQPHKTQTPAKLRAHSLHAITMKTKTMCLNVPNMGCLKYTNTVNVKVSYSCIGPVFQSTMRPSTSHVRASRTV